MISSVARGDAGLTVVLWCGVVGCVGLDVAFPRMMEDGRHGGPQYQKVVVQ